MTYNEFLEALKQTPRDWKLSEQQCLVRTDDDNGVLLKKVQCPITSLKRTGASRYHAVGEALGLAPELVVKIAWAADNMLEPMAGEMITRDELQGIRNDLLLATGLFPEK